VCYDAVAEVWALAADVDEVLVTIEAVARAEADAAGAVAVRPAIFFIVV
jgi:hypothetical protein